LDYSILDY